jgi:hypothetical protein
MSNVSSFPYPALLIHLPGSLVSTVNDYYSIRPNKTIRLMVKINPAREETGLYVFSSKTNIYQLSSVLKSFRIVHNFDSEKDPWIFMDESSGHFYRDLERLAAWVKTLNTK